MNLGRTVYGEENISIVIGDPEVREAENLRPVTDEAVYTKPCVP